MELYVEKIQKERKRRGWTLDDLARACELKSKQHVFYFLKAKRITAAEMFGKALDFNPKDLIK